MRLRGILIGAFLLLFCAPKAHAVAPIFTETSLRGTHAARAMLDLLARKPSGVDRAERVRTTAGRHYKAIVILLQFPPDPAIPGDLGMLADTLAHPPSAYDSLLFGSTQPTGSLRDYYREVSRGIFDIDGVVTRWYTAPRPYGYYTNTQSGFGDPPMNAQQMAADAVALADADLDFRLFDNDGPDLIPNSGDDDGFVDAIFVVHAGPGAEETASLDDIGSHMWSLPSTYVSPDPGLIMVDFYTTEAEKWKGIAPHTAPNQIMSIGTFCHEFGHILGLPDLYDTSGLTTASEGIGEWDLMGSGNYCHAPGESLATSPSHLSAWSKIKLGWITSNQLAVDQPGVTLTPVESGGSVYRLWSDGNYTGEYFLIENRQPIGFDSGLVRRSVETEGVQAHGLLIYHVDESVSGNNNAAHKQVDVEEAGGAESVSGPMGVQNLDINRKAIVSSSACGTAVSVTGNRGDRYDPRPGPLPARDFNSTSCPSSASNCGDLSQVAVRNITESGTDITADLFVKGASVLRRMLSLDDAPRTGTTNNGNGMAEPGESVRLHFPLLNLNGTPSQPLYAKVLSLDAYATITAGDSIDYGSIAAAATDSGTTVEATINATPDPRGAGLLYSVYSTAGLVQADTVQLLVGVKTGICDDFENTAQRWYGIPVACPSVGEWHRESGANNTTGGAWAWKLGPVGLVGSYANDEDARLISQPIRLTGSGDTLSFYQQYDSASGRDGVSVEISADAGATWTLLHPVPEYPSPGDRWSGTQSSFAQAKVPLTGYGGVVQIAFRFRSLTLGVGLGWWIDDVNVNGDATCATTAVEVRRFTAATLTPGPAVRLEWDLEDGAFTTVGIDRAEEGGDRRRVATMPGGDGAGFFEDRNVASGKSYRYWLTASREGEAGAEAGPLGIAIPASTGVPRALALGRVRPNPFNPSATIPVSLDRDGRFVLRVFRADGTLVRTLFDGPGTAGTYRFTWDGTDDRGAALGTGLYFLKLQSGPRSRVEKAILLR